MDSSTLNHLLDDVHILVVDDERVPRLCLQGILESMGATVHRAKSQHTAIGLYFRLFKQGILPRAIITDWWLVDRGTEEFKSMRKVDPDNRHSTAALLIESIHDLDPEALIFVYTDDVKTAEKAKLPATIINKRDIPVYELASAIASDEKIAHQRVKSTINLQDQLSICSLLRPVCEELQSGGYKRMDTPVPGVLRAI